MRLLILLSALVLASCSKEVRSPSPDKVAERDLSPHVSGKIELEPGDGKVYVIKVPDSFGIETSSCLLHITLTGLNSIACTPPKIELIESSGR